jgi:GDP-mannose transporter
MLVAMIYTGSVSLQHLPVSLFTVFKNLTIIMIALGERHMFNATITPMMWLSFLLIVSSSVIGAVHDITFNAVGYFWMVLNCSISAGYILYMRKAIKTVDFADFDSVYYNNCLAVPVMTVLSLVVDDWPTFLRDYFHNGPLVESRSSLFTGMLVSSVSAFMISYSTAWSVRVASSTTYSMCGSLNKLPIAISGMIFLAAERASVNLGSIFSVLLAFASGLIYSLAQLRLKAAKAKDALLNNQGGPKSENIK